MATDQLKRPSNLYLWSGLLAVIAACLLWIAATRNRLPEVLVTAWSSGQPLGRMARDQWIATAMAMVVGPALILAFGNWITGKASSGWTLRLREAVRSGLGHDPSRASGESTRLSIVIGIATAVWLTALHAIIVRANVQSPPKLDMWPIVLWVAAWIVFIVAYVLFKVRRRLRSGVSA